MSHASIPSQSQLLNLTGSHFNIHSILVLILDSSDNDVASKHGNDSFYLQEKRSFYQKNTPRAQTPRHNAK
eukprot:c18142_g1_i1 orf=187-399(+)